MALFHGKETRLGYIIGKVVLSGSCTDVIGGTMTAGAFDAEGSGLITFAPPMVTAPIILANAFSAGAVTGSLMPVNITGVTVSNFYIEYYASGGAMNVAIIGEARL